MNDLNRYQQIRIQTATPGQLIQMLFDGAIRFMTQGLEAMKNGKIEDANRNLLRAQRIVAELQVSLDLERGGEIAENLNQIYDYIYRQLVDANVKNLPDNVTESIKLISELKEAWVEVLKTESKLEGARAPMPVMAPRSAVKEPGEGVGVSFDVAC